MERVAAGGLMAIEEVRIITGLPVRVLPGATLLEELLASELEAA
jgi:hypothetical protein